MTAPPLFPAHDWVSAALGLRGPCHSCLPDIASYPHGPMTAAAVLLFGLALEAPRQTGSIQPTPHPRDGRRSDLSADVRRTGARVAGFFSSSSAHLAGAALARGLRTLAPPFATQSRLHVARRRFFSAVSRAATFGQDFPRSYLLIRGVPQAEAVDVLGEDIIARGTGILGVLLPLPRGVRAPAHAPAPDRAPAERAKASARPRPSRRRTRFVAGVGVSPEDRSTAELRSEHSAIGAERRPRSADPSTADVAVVLLATPLARGCRRGQPRPPRASAAADARPPRRPRGLGLAHRPHRDDARRRIDVRPLGPHAPRGRRQRHKRRRVAGHDRDASRSSARSPSRPRVSWPGPGGRSALSAPLEALPRAAPAPFEQAPGRLLLYEATRRSSGSAPWQGSGLHWSRDRTSGTIHPGRGARPPR